MSKHFGKTWWGRQWLNSLTNIDYSNRLPRGSSYARNGSVSIINIVENSIKAKVKGSLSSPYDVSLIIAPFFPPEIKKLVKAVAQKPVIVSKLLNRELDPELLNIAERMGLKVFPKQWTDFKMQCSCPDWAVPCKHLAAVIYKISAEIDNNPFLVFDLHRVNLPEELKKENIFIGTNSNTIPVLKTFLIDNSKKTPASKKKLVATATRRVNHVKNEQSPVTAKAITEANNRFNYTSLSPIHEPMIQLLADAPVFYQENGNFKEKYSNTLRKVVRNAQRIISGKSNMDEHLIQLPVNNRGTIKKQEQFTVAINHHNNIALGINENNEVTIWIDGKKQNAYPYQLLTTLWQIPKAQLQDYQPSVAALHNSLLLALNLIANGAIVPQIIQLENKSYTVRFLPALISKEVTSLIDNLHEILPPGILMFSAASNIDIEKDTAVLLVSILIDHIVFHLSENRGVDVFIDLFFSNYSYAFNAPGQQSLPGGIQAWLQRYTITQGNYIPMIMVEELQEDRFMISINIQERNRPLVNHIPLLEVLTLKTYEQQRFEILQSLAQLSSFIPGLDNYINTKGDDLIIMDVAVFTPFLIQVIPSIKLLNVNILLPKSLQHILKPKASVHLKRKEKDPKAFMRLDKLLDFEWQVSIGDTVLNENDFNTLLKNSEGLIRYKSNYIYVSKEELEKLHKHFAASKDLTPYEMLRTALGNDYYGAAISLTEEVKQLIKELTTNEDIPLPGGINASLRPYQQRGFSWMYRNTKIGFGSVLADDMGLGKTLQVITTFLKYKEDGSLKDNKALVIAPTGLLTNWQAEMEKFAPSLQFRLYHGLNRRLDKKMNFDVLLTSYGVARIDADKLKKIKWHVVVTDEAQNIKNHETAQSKAVKSIPANTFIAMSGTPVENRLSELWSIMDFSNRGLLGSLPDFKENFAVPIQNLNDVTIAQKLKTVTSPFLMRRLKSDKTIIDDLPEKIEIDSFSHLAKEQAGLYEKTLHKAMETIEAIQLNDQKSLFVRQGLVLQMILALKQICNHPTHFLKNNVLDASLSGKMELLFDKLDSIKESNEKVLIFTQFTEMGNLLKHFITERFGETPLFYHGGCSLQQRKEMVEHFQTNRADNVFILSLRAAGTGLNLTAANHVIHYDLWWNPAVEAQATDRAYRIGQKRNVMVHRFITKGTFEERINEMIQSKKALADLTVATGESWIGNLSNKELKNIFELG